MLTLMDSASLDEAVAVALCDDVIRNRVVVCHAGASKVSIIDGYHCVVDWIEIDPPGTDYDAPGIPHRAGRWRKCACSSKSWTRSQ